jgi:DDE domain
VRAKPFSGYHAAFDACCGTIITARCSKGRSTTRPDDIVIYCVQTAGPARGLRPGHDACLQAIRAELGKRVRHWTNRFLNNRLEQDHRSIKGRCRPMLGCKSIGSAKRYFRRHDELRNFRRCRSRMLTCCCVNPTLRSHVPDGDRALYLGDGLSAKYDSRSVADHNKRES